MRVTHDREPPSGHLKPGAAILIVAIALVFLSLSAATTWGAADYFNRAQEYIDEGDLKAAMIELKNALRRDPDRVEARFLLGKVYLQLGQGASAEKELEKARKLGFEGDELELLLARARLRQGDFEEVISAVTENVAIESDIQADLFVARAEALLGLGRIGEAREILDLVLDRGPHARALGGKARIASISNDEEAARDLLDRALVLAPNDPTLVAFDAELIFRQRRFENARDRFARAIELDPVPLSPHLWKVQAHLALKELTEAQEILEKLKPEQTDNIAVILSDSILQLYLGRFQRASTAADKVLAVAVNDPSALYVSGASAFRLGRYEVARARLMAYLVQQPNDGKAQTLLGATLLRLGQANEAYDTVKDASGDQLDDLAYLSVLTSAALGSGYIKAGLGYLERIAEKKPGNAEVQENLGIARVAAGNFSEGIVALDRAIALDPGRLSAYTRLFAIRLQEASIDNAIDVARAVEARFPDSGTGSTMKGIAYLKDGDRNNAKRAFEKALKREPGDANAGGNLANVLWAEGDLDRARVVLDGVLAANPPDLRSLVKYAALEQEAGSAEKADALLRRAMDQHPDAVQPKILYARSRLKAGQPLKALELTEPLLAANQEDFGLLEVVGLAQLRIGDDAGAVSIFAKLAQLLPESPKVHAYLMNALERNGKIELALRSAQRALELDENMASVRFGRARYLAQLGRLDEAKAELAALRGDFPEAAEIYILESRIALMAGRVDEALAGLERAFEVRRDSGTLLELGRARFVTGRRDAAIASYQEWLEVEPKDIRVRNALAHMFLSVGDLEQARRQFRALLERVPKNTRLMNNLAWLEAELGAEDEAIRLARSALELAPNSPEIADTLAVILLNTGESNEALRLLKKAVQLSPDHPVIRFHFSRALSETGETDAAISELQALLASADKFPERDLAELLLRRLMDR